MSGSVTTQQFDVRYHDVGFDMKLSPVALMDYFLDAAIYQSEKFGVGMDYLSERGVVWFLHRWSIRIERMPSLYEKVTVKTQPYSLRKFYAYRKFWLLDEKENELASANSMWIYVDVEKRKPLRVNPEIHRQYGVPEGFDEPLEFEDFEPPVDPHYEHMVSVRRSDTDTNDHVNNASYIDWAMESVPEEVLRNKTISSIEVVYEHETHYGKSVRVESSLVERYGDAVFVHAIYENSGLRLALARTNWR